jgi:hypothetical protein
MAIVSSHVDIPDVDASEEEEEDDDHSVAPVSSRTRDVIRFSGVAGAVEWRYVCFQALI